MQTIVKKKYDLLQFISRKEIAEIKKVKKTLKNLEPLKPYFEYFEKKCHIGK